MKQLKVPKPGRGMVKWGPFAAMSEQFQGINQIIQEQVKVPRPILDEQQKEEIGWVLRKALHLEQEVDIWYYKDGFIFHEVMDVKKIDLNTNQITTTDAFRFENKLYLTDVVDCKLRM